MSTAAPNLALILPGQPARELAPGASPTAGRRVLELVHRLLVDSGCGVHDVARVIVGVGPGGFTGLRISIATALGLGQALGIPVIGASSLEALALGVDGLAPGSTVAAITDARRGEVFAASFRRSGEGLEEGIPAGAYAPADFAARLAADGGAAVCVGTGAVVYGEVFASAGLAVLSPEDPSHVVRALHLISRVAHGAERPARPDYQRLPDAEVNRLVALG